MSLLTLEECSEREVVVRYRDIELIELKEHIVSNLRKFRGNTLQNVACDIDFHFLVHTFNSSAHPCVEECSEER